MYLVTVQRDSWLRFRSLRPGGTVLVLAPDASPCEELDSHAGRITMIPTRWDHGQSRGRNSLTSEFRFSRLFGFRWARQIVHHIGYR
jgi:hypothetical protein